MEEKEITSEIEKEDNTDYKLLFVQKTFEALKLELALEEAIERIIPDLVTSQELNFEEACESLKVELLNNAHKIILDYLNNPPTDEESSDE